MLIVFQLLYRIKKNKFKRAQLVREINRVCWDRNTSSPSICGGSPHLAQLYASHSLTSSLKGQTGHG